MKFSARSRTDHAPPGLLATVRVDRRTRALLPRLAPGDIAVVDHLDLDRATAQALADAGVRAVVNASAFISGRYPNLGPEILTRAGVTLVEAGPGALTALRDNQRVRLHEGGLYVDDELMLQGRVLGTEDVVEQMGRARSGLAAQLSSFTHNSTEFLRREEDLLLHGQGAPSVSTVAAGRAVVVVVDGPGVQAELAGIRRFVRESDPVLIGVDTGADVLLAAGMRPDVVVLGAGAGSSVDQWPSAKAIRTARDVVVRVDRGGDGIPTEQTERLVPRALRFETGATTEDAALLLADLADAELVIGVGVHATLDEFLDRQRSGIASTYLTRLRLGPKLVDAAAVPTLYSGRVRGWHVLLVLAACLTALVAALGVTPVGQAWGAELADALRSLIHHLQGLL